MSNTPKAVGPKMILLVESTMDFTELSRAFRMAGVPMSAYNLSREWRIAERNIIPGEDQLLVVAHVLEGPSPVGDIVREARRKSKTLRTASFAVVRAFDDTCEEFIPKGKPEMAEHLIDRLRRMVEFVSPRLSRQTA